MNSWADQVDEEDRSNRLQGDWRSSRYDYPHEQRPNWRQNKPGDIDRASSWRSASEQLVPDHGGRTVHHAPQAPGPSQPVKILKRPDGPKQHHQSWSDSPVHSHSPLGEAPMAGRPYGSSIGQGAQHQSRAGRMSTNSLPLGHARGQGGFADHGSNQSADIPNVQGPPTSAPSQSPFVPHHPSAQMGQPMAPSQPRPSLPASDNSTTRTAQPKPFAPAAARQGPTSLNQRVDQAPVPGHPQPRSDQVPVQAGQRPGLHAQQHGGLQPPAAGGGASGRGPPQVPVRGPSGPAGDGPSGPAPGTWPPNSAVAMGMDPSQRMDPGQRVAAAMQVPLAAHSMQPPPGIAHMSDFQHMMHEGAIHPGAVPPPPRVPQTSQAHHHMQPPAQPQTQTHPQTQSQSQPQYPPHSQSQPQPQAHHTQPQPQPHHNQPQPHHTQPQSHHTQPQSHHAQPPPHQIHPQHLNGPAPPHITPIPDYPPHSIPPVRTSSATPAQDPSNTPKSATHPSANGLQNPSIPRGFGLPMGSAPLPVDFSQMGGPRMPALTGQPAELMHQMMMMAQMNQGMLGMPMMPPGQQLGAPPSMGYQVPPVPPVQPPSLPSDGTPPPPPPPPQGRSAQPSTPSAAQPAASSAPAFPAPPPVPATAATVAHIENTAIQQADLYQQLESMKKQSMQQSHALQYVMTYMQYLLPQFQALQARNQQLERENQQLTVQQQQSQKMVTNMQEVVKNMEHLGTAGGQDGGSSSPIGPPPHIEGPSPSAGAAPPGFSKPVTGQPSASTSSHQGPIPAEDRGRNGAGELETNGETTWGGRAVGKNNVPPLPRHPRTYHEDGFDTEDGQMSTARTTNSHADDEREGPYRRGGRSNVRRSLRVGDADMVLEVPRPVTPQTPTPRSGRERTGTKQASPGDRRGVNTGAARSRRKGPGQDLAGGVPDHLPTRGTAPGKPARSIADGPTADYDAPPPGFAKKAATPQPNGVPPKERDSRRDRDHRDVRSERDTSHHDREPQREREGHREREGVSSIDAVDLQSKISNLLRPVGSGKLPESSEGGGHVSAGDRGNKGASKLRASMTDDSRLADDEALPERPRRERRKHTPGSSKPEPHHLGAPDPAASPRMSANNHDSGAGSERERRRRMPLQLYTPPKRTVGEGESKGAAGENQAAAAASVSS